MKHAIRWAQLNPRMALLSTGIGMALAFVGNMAWNAGNELLTPKYPTLKTIWITGYASMNNRWLHVMYHVPSAGKCIRMGTMILYRDDKMEGRLYYTLGGVLNGSTLAGTVQEFTLLFYLPPDLSSGIWSYIYRIHYECPPNGMIRWEYTTKPERVEIP